MKAIARLKQDHVVLRTRLNELEETLPVEPATRVTCRIKYRLFLYQHAKHLQRKERVITSCRGALATLVPEELGHAEHEHQYALQLFRRVGRLLLCGRQQEQPRNKLCVCFSRATAKLHRLMDEEETALWPAIQHTLIRRERGGNPLEASARVSWDGIPDTSERVEKGGLQ